MSVCTKNLSFHMKHTRDNQIWGIKSNRIFQPGKGMALGDIAETCSVVSDMWKVNLGCLFSVLSSTKLNETCFGGRGKGEEGRRKKSHTKTPKNSSNNRNNLKLNK